MFSINEYIDKNSNLNYSLFIYVMDGFYIDGQKLILKMKFNNENFIYIDEEYYKYNIYKLK